MLGEAVCADIENGPWPFAGRSFDGVIVTNYLWRALLPTIVASVAPGGVLIYETFAQGNETVGGDQVGHLWNYGLNTWGWEADYKGGDRDYNDLVVQIDFTSAYGEGWLM